MSMVMTDTALAEGWTFGGVDTLNGTQIPDAYFDEVMAPLGPSAFTVLMYVARRTFGFKRHSDQISLDQICHGIVTAEVRDADGAVIKPARQLDHGTGLAKSTVVRALDRLIAAGLIHKRHNIDPRRGQLANTYAIVFKDPSLPTRAALPVCQNRPAPAQEAESPPVAHRDTPCRAITQAPVADLDTQQTVETTNSRRQTDISKRGGRALRPRQPLDSTDSTIMTSEIRAIEPTLLERPVGPDLAPVGVQVARLSAEFGDDAPHASRTRVLNMQRTAGLGDEAILALLDEAATIAWSQGLAITKRGRGGTVIRMPYLLATLQGLVDAPDGGASASAQARSPASAPPAIVGGDGMDDPPVTTAAEAVWREVRGELRRDLTPENYARWVEATTAASLDGDVLRVGVPDEAHRQWLGHKLRGCIERAIERTGHEGVCVAYDIAPLKETTSSGDQATQVNPAPSYGHVSATVIPSPALLYEASDSTFISHPHVASITGLSPVVACPTCRAAPCQCRLTDQLRRVAAIRAAPARVGIL